MKEPTRIGPLTEDPVPAYRAGIDAAQSPKELRAFLRGWSTLAPDARKAARGIKAADWAEFRRGLESERRGVFAGEPWAERYLAILMPARMYRTSDIAHQFFVPWGVAWKRLRDLNMLDVWS